MKIDFFGIIFDFWENVISPFITNAYNFLFNEIAIGEYTIVPFYLIGGGLFFVLVVAWMVNKIFG